jgi:hypothetical protein
MNIARLFSYTRHVERELRRERILRRRDELRHERERKALIDAVQRNANKPAVFDRDAPPKQSSVPSVAFGPSMSAARQEAKRKEAEIIQKAEAVKANNGHRVDAPTIPAE